MGEGKKEKSFILLVMADAIYEPEEEEEEERKKRRNKTNLEEKKNCTTSTMFFVVISICLFLFFDNLYVFLSRSTRLVLLLLITRIVSTHLIFSNIK